MSAIDATSSAVCEPTSTHFIRIDNDACINLAHVLMVRRFGGSANGRARSEIVLAQGTTHDVVFDDIQCDNVFRALLLGDYEMLETALADGHVALRPRQ